MGGGERGGGKRRRRWRRGNDKEKKEVISREVVFEYIPPTPTDETSESPAFTSLDNQSPENQSPMLDLWSGESTSQNLQENQTAPKTYKRKQAKSEDTINSLTELLFEEEAAPVENSQLKSQSKSQSKSELQPEKISTPEIQQETATTPQITTSKTTPPEIQQLKQPEPPTQPIEEKPQQIGRAHV